MKAVDMLPVESTDALDVSEEKDIVSGGVCIFQMPCTNFQILVPKVMLGVDLRVRFRKFVLALCSVAATEFGERLVPLYDANVVVAVHDVFRCAVISV